MSWLFSQALVEEYLGDIFLDGEQSVQLNGSPIQLAYLSQDKMTKFFRLSRFGMMFKPLTENLGKELLMSYLEDFHAKTLAQPEKAQELTETEVQCGNTWRELLAKFDPNTALWKTAQCSLLEDSEQSLEIWPRSGSMRNGECFQRQMLVQTTKEKEFGYWLTPATIDIPTRSAESMKKRLEYRKKIGRNGVGAGCLAEQVTWSGTGPPIGYLKAENWPTPDANCGKRGTQPEWTPKRKSGHPAQYTINQAVRDSFSTPVARMWKDNGTSPSELNRNSETLAVQAGGKLNPTWVEWLMGWPLQWTDLKPLEMDKCHFVQQQLGNCSEKD